MTEHSALSSLQGDKRSPVAREANPAADAAQEDPAILLLRVADGDRRAFKRLYDLTSGRFIGLAERLLSRRDLAEDVLQEVYVRVWLHAGKYDPQRGAPMPWLWQILRNSVIDRLRRDSVVMADLGDFADVLAAPSTPVEARLDLAKGLSRLDAKKTDALAMAFIEGYTHEEIAEALDAPLGTVKSQVRRSLLQLRKHLEGYDLATVET